MIPDRIAEIRLFCSMATWHKDLAAATLTAYLRLLQDSDERLDLDFDVLEAFKDNPDGLYFHLLGIENRLRKVNR